jgi:hypothetical protein
VLAAMEPSSTRSATSINITASRRSVNSTPIRKKKGLSNGSWKTPPLDEFVKGNSLSSSSNTTCVTAEMSVSPDHVDGKPKFQLNPTSCVPRKNSKPQNIATQVSAAPILSKKPASNVYDAIQISEDEASDEAQMSEDDVSNGASAGGSMSEDDGSRHSYESSSNAGSSVGLPYSEEFEESEGSSHAYLSAIGIGNPDRMGSFRDTKHQNVVAHRPQKPQSQYSTISSTSYGSMSLDGDKSMSSMDSFRNSPKQPGKPIVTRRVLQPNPAAKPPKPILREKEQPKIPTRRRYYSDDESESDSEVSQLSASVAPDSASSLSAASASSYASSFLPSDRSGASSRETRVNRFSASSGDVSIPTISDHSSDSDGNGSLPAFPPLHSGGSSRSSNQPKSKRKEEAKKESLTSNSFSSFTGESWNTPVPTDSLSQSLSATCASGNRSSNGSRPLSESNGSWTLSVDWSTPQEADAHWASPKSEVETWTSGDESETKNSRPATRKKSISSRGSRTSKSSKGSKKSLGSRTSKSSKGSKQSLGSKSSKGSKKRNSKKKKTETRERSRSVPTPPKPRSADDKNAPWYCGYENDEEEDVNDGNSIASDSSSVLSAFKKKKTPKTKPVQEQSMSFSGLLGSRKMSSRPALSDQSMSLGDLNQNGDKSMSLGDLNQNTEKSMTFDDLNNDGASSIRRSTPLDMLQEEPLESFSLDDLQSLNLSEEDKGGPSGKFDSVDETLPVGLQAPSGPDSIHPSNEESAPNRSEREGASPRDSGGDAKDKSMRMLRWILIVGFVLFLMFDLILLTIFLTQRATDNAEPSSVLATVPETLCWDWVPGQGKSLLCTADDTASGGAVANLVAQAIRRQSPQPADISLIPAGLTIGDIAKGDFTSSDAEKVVRTTNSPGRRLRGRQLDETESLMIVEGTGAKIMQVLEMSLEDSLSNGQSHSYPYSAGLRYSVDSNAPPEQRVISPVALNDEVWGALNSDKLYTVITTKDWANTYFLLQGTAVSMTPLTALIGYAQNEKTLFAPEYSTREFVAQTETPSQEPEVPGIGGLNEGNSTFPFVEGNICLEWVPGQGLSNFCSREETAARGGGVGNLVAWGLLTELQTHGEPTEMFLLKASDCQIDIAEGPFEDHEATALIPVNEEIVFLTLSGYQLVDVLEEALEYVIGTASNSGSYPYAGGLRFKVDPNAAFGSRFTEIEWFSRGRWKVISLVANYQLATTFTLAEGGAGYGTLLDALTRIDTNFLIRNVFMDYAIDVGILRNPPESRFSTQQYST